MTRGSAAGRLPDQARNDEAPLEIPRERLQKVLTNELEMGITSLSPAEGAERDDVGFGLTG
jgi:hypothetical protein